MMASGKRRRARGREIGSVAPRRSSGLSHAAVPAAIGTWAHAFAAELFPICRSITGDGLRRTLRRIQQEIPITIHEVPSGTPVLDWTIPDEWNIRDAWIKNARGERIVDFRKSNLHVVNYSVPVCSRMSLAELEPHLHSLRDRPDWIPYRTTYYKRDWGFCLAEREREQLRDAEYDVCIDATLAPGGLSYGELLIPGQNEQEFLISSHCCHPSLANDNLSGIAIAAALATTLQKRSAPRRFTYRFVFVPGTIGAITWLARHEKNLQRIEHGLVLTCLGDAAEITYKRSRRGNGPIDVAAERVLRAAGLADRIIDFSPYGYDERQYCSPGFDLPIGCLMRSSHGTFPEYHTSADNLDLIKPEALADSFAKLVGILDAVESIRGDGRTAKRFEDRSRIAHLASRTFLNLKPRGEPQLGKYGIYEALNGDVTPALWVLNFSDGRRSLDDIATKSGLPFDKLAGAADILLSRGLLKEVES
jgi:aminopeptidase-like protein